MPPKEESVPVVADDGDDEYSTKGDNPERVQGKQGKRSNPNENVGGTAKDGGLSTEDTVRDGGEDAAADDPDYKPS